MVSAPLPFPRVRALVLVEIRPSTGFLVGILRLWVPAILPVAGESCYPVPRVDIPVLPARPPPSRSLPRPLPVTLSNG